MRHPDAERPNGTGHPMPVAMIVLLLVAMKMDMRTVIMVMAVDMPPFPVQFPRQCPAQGNKQEPDTGLGKEFKSFGDADIPRQYHRADEQERRRMANPPPKTNGAGRPKRRPFG